MATSRTTTSGRCSRTADTSARPSTAFATMSHSGASSFSKASTSIVWSSAMMIRGLLMKLEDSIHNNPSSAQEATNDLPGIYHPLSWSMPSRFCR